MPVAAIEPKGKVTFREDRCKGCGLCATACPRKLIVVSNRLNNQGYPVAELTNPEKCNGCALCAEMCPDVVIEVWR
ncbi:MAG: ferredoxin family protein [Deltaproteobacteria bacterium]|nr:ferredoxin family protein [Deltaproteobacteria bacterium]